MSRCTAITKAGTSCKGTPLPDWVFSLEKDIG
jgi:hypothetical protein